MLDMGFQDDIERILNTIKDDTEFESQIIIFSDTFPKWLQEITANLKMPISKNFFFIN